MKHKDTKHIEALTMISYDGDSTRVTMPNMPLFMRLMDGDEGEW